MLSSAIISHCCINSLFKNNYAEDPLAMFEHEPRPPHSILKMMRDMYSTRATASIFYTNDERVVCDIIIRQLTDLPADDKVGSRKCYLHLYEKDQCDFSLQWQDRQEWLK